MPSAEAAAAASPVVVAAAAAAAAGTASVAGAAGAMRCDCPAVWVGALRAVKGGRIKLHVSQ
jgi:hypothetical protein